MGGGDIGDIGEAYIAGGIFSPVVFFFLFFFFSRMWTISRYLNIPQKLHKSHLPTQMGSLHLLGVGESPAWVMWCSRWP